MIWILTGIFCVAQLISLIVIISLRKKLKKAEQKEIYYKSRVSAPALHSDNTSNNDTTFKNEAQPLLSVPDVETYLAQSRNSAMASHIENRNAHTYAQEEPIEEPTAEPLKPVPAAPLTPQKTNITPVMPAASAQTAQPIQMPAASAQTAQPMEMPAASVQATQPIEMPAASAQAAQPVEVNPQMSKKRQALYQLINERAELDQPFKNQNQIKSFLKEFNEAYPGYLSGLRHTYKELTGSDELVIALMVNELSIQQICALLESKPRTIWSRRLRIKNHLNLTTNDDIDEWVRNSIVA